MGEGIDTAVARALELLLTFPFYRGTDRTAVIGAALPLDAHRCRPRRIMVGDVETRFLATVMGFSATLGRFSDAERKVARAMHSEE